MEMVVVMMGMMIQNPWSSWCDREFLEGSSLQRLAGWLELQ